MNENHKDISNFAFKCIDVGKNDKILDTHFQKVLEDLIPKLFWEPVTIDKTNNKDISLPYTIIHFPPQLQRLFYYINRILQQMTSTVYIQEM